MTDRIFLVPAIFLRKSQFFLTVRCQRGMEHCYHRSHYVGNFDDLKYGQDLIIYWKPDEDRIYHCEIDINPNPPENPYKQRVMDVLNSIEDKQLEELYFKNAWELCEEH